MRKETCSIKCPRRFVFGDPSYFEKVKGEKLQSLIACYKLPKGFDPRIVLEEYPDFKERTMTLYMAPEKTIQTYVDVMEERNNNQAVQTAG